MVGKSCIALTSSIAGATINTETQGFHIRTVSTAALTALVIVCHTYTIESKKNGRHNFMYDTDSCTPNIDH